MKEQIEEIAKTLCHHYNTRHCEVCDHHGRCMVRLDAECIYNAGYRKQSEGDWKPSPSGSTNVYCSLCGAMSGGGIYCSYCGAKMKVEKQ